MTGKPHIEKTMVWLREQGAENVRLEHDSKHPKIFYVWRGAERFYVISWTPKNEDSCARLSVRDLRHEMGLVGGKRVGKRRRHHDRAPAPPIELPSITPGPSWQGELVAHPARRADWATRLDAAWLAWWRARCRASGYESRL